MRLPNWCANDLRILGPTKDVEAFRTAAKGFEPAWPLSDSERKQGIPDEPKQNDVLCFNALYPVPAELVTKGYDKNAVAWLEEHWGVRHDLGSGKDITIEPFAGGSYYRFDTAWSPPRGVIEEAARRFPGLTFRLTYYELGNMICGVRTWQGGRLVEEEDFRHDTPDFWAFMAKEFEDVDRADYFDDEDGASED